MIKKISLIILMCFLINIISATQVCEVYDDFSSGVFNNLNWEIKQDLEEQGFIDEYYVDKTLMNFHTQQKIYPYTKRGVFLTPKHSFKTGDIFEYDFNVSMKELTHMQMTLLTGDQYIRIGIAGYLNGIQGYDEIGQSHVKLEFQEKNLHIERISPSNVTLIDNLALTNSNGTYGLYVGTYTGADGQVHIDFDNFKLCTTQEEDVEYRVSLLESWMNSINLWKNSIEQTLSSLALSISSLLSKTNNHEERIIALENSSITESLTPNYWKYLSENERKNILCGYAQDNRLTSIEDLGLKCSLTYPSKASSKVSCKCKK